MGRLNNTSYVLTPAALGAIAVAFVMVIIGTFLSDQRLAVVTIVVATFVTVAAMVNIFLAQSGSTFTRNQLKNLITHDKRALLVTDHAGEVVTRNFTARKLFGEIGGNSFVHVLEPYVSNASAVIFRLQAKASRSYSAREEIVTAKGRFTISVHRVYDDYFVWAIEEVSDRETPGRMADNISVPMVSASRSGAIHFMNDAMRRLVGGHVKSLDKLFIQTPQNTDELHTLTAADGPIKVRVSMFSGGGEKIEYYLCPIEEGTNSDQASYDALEDFPAALLKMSPDGTVQEASKLARELLKIDENTKTNLSDLVEGLGRHITELMAEASEGRALHKPYILKFRGIKDEIYLQMTLGRVIEAGEVHLVAILNDATEHKSLEAQFVQSQKMQAIGQLAGGVAHDFNNLLTAISGHCDLLMLRHDPSDPDFGDLQQINQNANRAASLVGQLLAFSRKQNLQLEILDMRDALADLTHLLNRLVGAQVTLKLSHDPNLASVRVDRRQLEQVIMNLVVNARDAMDGGGEIAIETRNKKLQSDLTRDRAVVPRGEYVVVKVSDTGAGIAKDKIQKIFEPFFTTKKTGEGTGLGLSTAYGIVKQTGGFIFVDSEIDKGTTFTIFLPSHTKPMAQAEKVMDKKLPKDAGPADGVVLLVEDEAPVRAFASRALKLRGYQVIEAENAEEALNILEDNALTIDVVVSDVVMPGMDGPSWVKQARLTRPNMRVVFISGYAEDSFVADQADIPNSVFLPKPFSLNELTTVVRGQLSDVA